MTREHHSATGSEAAGEKLDGRKAAALVQREHDREPVPVGVDNRLAHTFGDCCQAEIHPHPNPANGEQADYDRLDHLERTVVTVAVFRHTWFALGTSSTSSNEWLFADSHVEYKAYSISRKKNGAATAISRPHWWLYASERPEIGSKPSMIDLINWSE